MPRINGHQTEVPEVVREFRRLLDRLAWDAGAFAHAARIKRRSAAAMVRGEARIPERLMIWLRSVAAAADQLPPPPAGP